MNTAPLSTVSIPFALNFTEAASYLFAGSKTKEGEDFPSLEFVVDDTLGSRIGEEDRESYLQAGYRIHPSVMTARRIMVETHALHIDADKKRCVVTGKIQLALGLFLDVAVDCDLRDRTAVISGFSEDRRTIN